MGSTRTRQRIYSGRPCYQGKPVVSTLLVLTLLSSSTCCFLLPRRTESPPSKIGHRCRSGSRFTFSFNSTSTLPRHRVHGRAGLVERSSGLHCRSWPRRKRILFTSRQRTLMSYLNPGGLFPTPSISNVNIVAGHWLLILLSLYGMVPSVRIRIDQYYGNSPHFPWTNDRFAVRTDEPSLNDLRK